MAETDRATPLNSPPRRSLFALITSLPNLIAELVRAEIEQAKAEITAKLVRLGIGAGFFAVAAAVLFFALGVFVAAAILGLAVVLPGWAAALIVGGVLVILAVVLIAIGMRSLQAGSPPTPSETATSIRRDINAVKGVAPGDRTTKGTVT